MPSPHGITWQHSVMKEPTVQALVDANLLQPRVELECRPAYGNAWQFKEHPKETVMLAHFVERGLAVPTSNFFKGILEYYNLQLVPLNPNGVLHMAIFVHLCEVYLGVLPSLDLFKKLFRCKPQPNANRTEVFNGAGFQLRNSSAYLEYDLLDSHGDWKKRWFYIGNHDPVLPIITSHAPKYADNWVTEPEDTPEITNLLAQITDLRTSGLTGINVAASFLKRRVQPLQQRAHSGFKYTSFDDPSRMSSEDVSDDDVEALLGKLFRNYQGVLVLPGLLRQFDSWYGPTESRVLLGFLPMPSKGKEVAEGNTEDAPSAPPAKRRQVVQRCWRYALEAIIEMMIFHLYP
ncbi:uncharacterized protein LOC111256491 [Setaria italica]|uniref:uncharacterized protein LOC111256491 n=1 Tax=Setaria italica TaxID=4555 RepID=UPI000BE5B2AF|nr:uncharacterized protein LOC111256491 [Setaria italica]